MGRIAVSMPLGVIHIFQGGDGVGVLCGADALAAVKATRLKDFPAEMICPACMQIYQDGEASRADAAASQ